ncbi:histone-lysine n- h3 lysine-79 specific-like [Hordeum vulgare]|nr:histone-lysine n- h3 lysine-79 specific-like [Hordeum vulgare]
MRVNSEQCWLAYKDTVAESLDKALELFAIKINVPNLHLDLNRVASPIGEAIPPRINEEANIKPVSAQQSSIQHEPLLEENDEHDDDENDDTVLHDNNLGDLDKHDLQETMDHSIPYSRGYASESDDEGPDEEVDEEGFTAKDGEAFTKVVDLLGLVCVDTYEDHFRMTASQPNKATTEWGEDKDAVGEDHQLWGRAAKKLKEEDTSKVQKKKEEEYEARMKEELKITIDHYLYERRIKEEHKKLTEKIQREFAASYKKATAESATKREREHQRFTERVMKEASKMRKR